MTRIRDISGHAIHLECVNGHSGMISADDMPPDATVAQIAAKARCKTCGAAVRADDYGVRIIHQRPGDR